MCDLILHNPVVPEAVNYMIMIMFFCFTSEEKNEEGSRETPHRFLAERIKKGQSKQNPATSHTGVVGSHRLFDS